MTNSIKGSLNKNKDKKTDKHPEYKGKLTLEDGQTIWLSGWVNTDKKTGEKYLSLQGKWAEGQAVPQPASSEVDDLPF